MSGAQLRRIAVIEASESAHMFDRVKTDANKRLYLRANWSPQCWHLYGRSPVSANDKERHGQQGCTPQACTGKLEHRMTGSRGSGESEICRAPR
jgi:hypothetical protein